MFWFLPLPCIPFLAILKKANFSFRRARLYQLCLAWCPQYIEQCLSCQRFSVNMLNESEELHCAPLLLSPWNGQRRSQGSPRCLVFDVFTALLLAYPWILAMPVPSGFPLALVFPYLHPSHHSQKNLTRELLSSLKEGNMNSSHHILSSESLSLSRLGPHL